jgi:hypothetical protein
VATTEQAYNYASGSPMNVKDPAGTYPARPDDDEFPIPGTRWVTDPNLAHMTDRQVRELAKANKKRKGEDYTGVIKAKSGKSGSDLYYDKRTGEIFTVPKEGASMADSTGDYLPDDIRRMGPHYDSQMCEVGSDTSLDFPLLEEQEPQLLPAPLVPAIDPLIIIGQPGMPVVEPPLWSPNPLIPVEVPVLIP